MDALIFSSLDARKFSEMLAVYGTLATNGKTFTLPAKVTCRSCDDIFSLCYLVSPVDKSRSTLPWNM